MDQQDDICKNATSPNTTCEEQTHGTHGQSLASYVSTPPYNIFIAAHKKEEEQNKIIRKEDISSLIIHRQETFSNR